MPFRFGLTIVFILTGVMVYPVGVRTGFSGDDRVVATKDAAFTQTGFASFYNRNLSGKMTASGEKYLPGKLTGAHRALPFGTLVKVTDLANGKSVTVRINDRGPHSAKRIIDLSGSAAKAIGLVRKGIAKVRIEIVRE